MNECVRELGITLGERCNFRCRHCSSYLQPPHELSKKEIGLIRDTIQEYCVKDLLLAGGEPTLYVEKANRILTGLPGLENFSVRTTTNGHFGRSLSEAKKVLKSFARLTDVQVSYDRFHADYLPFENIGNIFQACRELGIRFSVSFCVSDPLDMVLLEKLKRFGSFSVGVQKVLPVGAAAMNGLGYKHPEFDKEVLSKSCPRKGKVVYLGGCGFSICCSTLVLSDKNNKFSHPTLKEHLESDFYKLVSRKRFGDIAGQLKVPENEFLPVHSDPCSMCEYLFLGRKACA